VVGALGQVAEALQQLVEERDCKSHESDHSGSPQKIPAMQLLSRRRSPRGYPESTGVWEP
jgi:hypothetical protein